VFNDILIELDNRNIMCLVLLDLSAAFDTVDHRILLQRLESSQNIRNGALDWISSYLSDRSQRVEIQGTSSEPAALSCGMPQGSKIDPRFYSQYTAPIGRLLTLLLVFYHLYADDTQVMKSANPRSHDSVSHTVKAFENALVKVAEWMTQNMLKLNCDKTEFIIFGSKYNLNKCDTESIDVCDETVLRAKCVRNLGVIMDEELSMLPHISTVVKTCRFHLRALWKIRHFLCEDTAKEMVHAVILSKLDYCNGVLINLPESTTRKLQLIMNEVARLISLTPRREHIEPVLFRLHWLPVK
jgi:hypothetical protein